MNKLIEAVKLINEVDKELNKNNLTIRWKFEIEPYYDITPLLGSTLQKALQPQESAETA